MIKNIFEYSETILNLGLSIGSGLIIYATLIFIRQNWVNTIHYFITFLLLPPTTLVISKVISNNLSLSLGMIGALSIVRFRNPVKNPLELVIYFSLITIGIAFGVNPKWGILFVIVVLLILIFSEILLFFSKKFKKLNLFKYSFSANDGVLKNLIEVESSLEIEFLSNHPDLIYFSKNDKNFFYKISTDNKENINQIHQNLLNNKNIINIETRYGN
jgi:ABC-type multidrug transport system fused ATPase/permease subunit